MARTSIFFFLISG